MYSSFCFMFELLMTAVMMMTTTISASNLAGGYDVITATTIEISSLYICDPGIGDPEIFIRTNVDDSSWETSSIEATENYETLVWSGESYTYPYEITEVLFKVYDIDSDYYNDNELRGRVTLSIADDLFVDNGDSTASWISRTFYQAIHYNDGNCDEYLTFTITFDGYYITPSPTLSIADEDDNSDDDSEEEEEEKEEDGIQITQDVLIIIILSFIAFCFAVIVVIALYKTCNKPNSNEGVMNNHIHNGHRHVRAQSGGRNSPPGDRASVRVGPLRLSYQ